MMDLKNKKELKNENKKDDSYWKEWGGLFWEWKKKRKL